MIQGHFGGGFGAIAASHLHKIRGEGLGLRVYLEFRVQGLGFRI